MADLAARRGIRGDAVTAIQRFGSALDLNVHFHTLAVQGVFVEEGSGGLRFVPNPAPTDLEVAKLLTSISRRITRLARRHGIALDRPSEEVDYVDSLAGESLLLAGICRVVPFRNRINYEIDKDAPGGRSSGESRSARGLSSAKTLEVGSMLRPSTTVLGRLSGAFAVAVLLSTSSGASPALTASQKCEIAKNKAAAEKDVCLMAQRNKAIAGKTPDTGKCETAFSKAFAAAEKAAAKAGGSCPVTGDAAAMEQRVDLTQGGTAQFLAGEGRFQDNGDGTLTDAVTGLVWEKKSMDGSMHDVNQCFSLLGRCASFNTMSCRTDADCLTSFPQCQTGDCQVGFPYGMTIFQWVAQLNSTTFAGHTDWRVPTVAELETIVDYTVDADLGAPVVPPAFDSSCAASCTVTTCSCTARSAYWSSTELANDPTQAWFVDFGDGHVVFDDQLEMEFVRGVRTGP